MEATGATGATGPSGPTAPIALDPATCAHGEEHWEPTETRPDSAVRWLRCVLCTAFGYRRRGRQIVPFLCEVSGCKGPAVSRLPGQARRGGYKWRCREHEE